MDKIKFKISINDFTPKKILEFITSLDRRMLVQYAILLVALVSFIFGGFLPILVKNAKTMEQVKKNQFMIQGATARIAKIPEMKKEKAYLDARIKRVRENFLKSDEQDEFIRIVSGTAQKSGVKITGSKPRPPSIKLPPPFGQTLTEISYDLTLRGGYHELAAFFNGLERYPKNFIIQSFYIKGVDSEAGEHDATMVLTAFIRATPHEGLRAFKR